MNDPLLRVRIVGGRVKRAIKRLKGPAASVPRFFNSYRRRSRRFTGAKHGRFWWHQDPAHDYVPGVYRSLTAKEWRVIDAWYAETQRIEAIGEIQVPAMSLLEGFVLGNGIRRVVELGHFYGYSTLLTGFMLRSMGPGHKLVSIDYDQPAHDFVEGWVRKAGLSEQVSLYCGDSASEQAFEFALRELGGPPELMMIDSSAQRDHLIAELDRWVPAIAPGAIMLLNDTSVYARSFDRTGRGGVQQALDDWLPSHPEVEFISLNRGVVESDPRPRVYKDGVGLGILQKRLD